MHIRLAAVRVSDPVGDDRLCSLIHLVTPYVHVFSARRSEGRTAARICAAEVSGWRGSSLYYWPAHGRSFARGLEHGPDGRQRRHHVGTDRKENSVGAIEMGDIASSLMFAAIFLAAVSVVIFWIANTHPAPSQTLLIPTLFASVIGTIVLFLGSLVCAILWMVI